MIPGYHGDDGGAWVPSLRSISRSQATTRVRILQSEQVSNGARIKEHSDTRTTSSYDNMSTGDKRRYSLTTKPSFREMISRSRLSTCC